MKNTKLFILSSLALLSLGALSSCGGGGGGGNDEYDKDGRLILKLKNVYFETFDGTDTYSEILSEKFKVHLEPSNYSYDTWDEEVNTAVNGDSLPDVFQYNLKAYNFGSTYEQWIKYGMLKALPDDLSKWPNIKSLINNTSNIDALKIGGKLYGLPIANDISNPTKDFSNFTYVYRRDWAKAIDEKHKDQAGYTPIYKEGDVYTWEEFNRLVKGFKTDLEYASGTKQASVLVDEEWGFPSITNFYKDVPHCYTKDATGHAINAFTSDKYISGLTKAKQYVSDVIYSQDQYLYKPNQAKEVYLGGQAGIFYDNFSFANYISFRKSFKRLRKEADLDDGTALLKIMGEDNKFALEGTENWFSMTMFSYQTSDNKMEKVLDILDYLLTPEGTRLAIFGKEDYDFIIVGDSDEYDYDVNGVKIKLTEQGWERGDDGNYGPKINGAKYLRYMATLGNDTKAYDPYTDQATFELLNDWINDMKKAKSENKLRVVKEPADIDWMSTKTKNSKTEGLLTDANNHVKNYCFDSQGYKTIEEYKAKFDEDANWAKVLEEINKGLGF